MSILKKIKWCNSHQGRTPYLDEDWQKLSIIRNYDTAYTGEYTISEIDLGYNSRDIICSVEYDKAAQVEPYYDWFINLNDEEIKKEDLLDSFLPYFTSKVKTVKGYFPTREIAKQIIAYYIESGDYATKIEEIRKDKRSDEMYAKLGKNVESFHISQIPKYEGKKMGIVNHRFGRGEDTLIEFVFTKDIAVFNKKGNFVRAVIYRNGNLLEGNLESKGYQDGEVYFLI